MQTLVDVWNLCERATVLPTWAHTYVSMQARDHLADLQTLKEFLGHQSSVLFARRVAARWTSGISRVLNTRSLSPIFLPGDMKLLTPNVAAVVDRRAPTAIALVFGEEAVPSPIGPLSSSDLDSYVDPTPPRIVPAKNGIRVEDVKIELPHFTELQSYVASSAGFCVCSARDSQWLWHIRAAQPPC
jgi:hypothetical protein